MAKVINKTITTHLTNMKDGDVAEIVNWFVSSVVEQCTVYAKVTSSSLVLSAL